MIGYEPFLIGRVPPEGKSLNEKDHGCKAFHVTTLKE
jgi:hypothetical protein